MKRRILAILLVFAVMMQFTACNSSKNVAGGDEEVTILWYNQARLEPDTQMVIDEVNKLLKEKLNIKLDYQPINSSEYLEKMRVIIAANEEFDLCFTSIGTGFNNFASNEAFMPLNELLNSHGKDILKLIPEKIFGAVTIDKSIYAVPTLKDWAVEPVISYNEAMANKYGFDMSSVKSLKDLTPMFKVLKENEKGYMPTLNRGNASWFRFLPFETISGSPIGAFKVGEYDKIVNQYETEEAMEYFKLMREWYVNGYVRSDAATATSDGEYYSADNFFASYGESLPYAEETNRATQPLPERYKKYIYGAAPIMLGTNNVQGAMQAISATSKNPEKAMEFLNLLYVDKEVKNLITQGIEGRHYKRLDENRVTWPDGFEDYSKTGYYPNTEYCTGNRFLSDLQVADPDDKWEAWQKFNEEANISEALGFSFDGSGLTTELAAMQNVYQEYMPSLLVGAVDPEVALPKAMEKFRIAGMDKVLAEMQRQYDEWKSNK